MLPHARLRLLASSLTPAALALAASLAPSLAEANGRLTATTESGDVGELDKCVAEAEAEAQLGKASKVDGDDHTWTTMKGEECHAYVLMGADGTMKRSKGPYKVGAGELEECKKTAG